MAAAASTRRGPRFVTEPEGTLVTAFGVWEARDGNSMTYTPGNRVTHSQYGDGTIVSANEYHTIIDFDANGLRTFSSPLVVLTSASTLAQPKPVRRARAKRAVR